MSKYIHKRVWNYNSPLKLVAAGILSRSQSLFFRQVEDANLLKSEIVRKVEACRQSFFELLDYEAGELGEYFKNSITKKFNSLIV